MVALVAVLALIAIGAMGKQRKAERRAMLQMHQELQQMRWQSGGSLPPADPGQQPPHDQQPPHPQQFRSAQGPYPPQSGPDRLLDEVRVLVRQGRKIEAIKRYRELTGLGLRESKIAVEQLESGLR